MPKNKSSEGARPGWRLLRLALVCTRKRLVAKLQHALNHLKLFQNDNLQSYQLQYYELSFDKTPTFRSKKYQRSLFPCCIDPPLIDSSDDEDNDYNCSNGNNDNNAKEVDEMETDKCKESELEGEAGIDMKAEEFISRFYEEMRLQRQASCLKYDEMLYRGMS